MDNVTGASRKGKQAEHRSTRQDVRKLLKPWEVTKLALGWRNQLHVNNLTREDIEATVDDATAYTRYKPSQPAVNCPMPPVGRLDQPRVVQCGQRSSVHCGWFNCCDVVP
eukprot:11245741-Heterocapsa_arctica.AAC.1